MKSIEDGPSDAPLTFVFAHGAGAAMDTSFMERIASGVAGHGWHVVRFEFPYMTKRRDDGKRRPPDRMPVLLETFESLVNDIGPDRSVVGGKSMGGRVASMIADDACVRGCICLGYPFHPPGKPEKLRTEHLQRLSTPTLILQGERDPFGKRDEMSGFDLSAAIAVDYLTDGDHGFKPRKASGETEEGNIDRAVTLIDRFLAAL